MNKHLKFRAWLQNTKTMEYPSKNWQMFMWAEDEKQPIVIMQFSGLQDPQGVDIYEGDKVYLAGYGVYDVEFPFTELYEAKCEGDVGEIVGNTYESI